MKGNAPLPVPTEATNLIRLYRTAQERRGDLPNSIEKREQCLRALARALDPRGLLDVTRQEIELFLDKRRTREGHKLSDRTRYLWIAHLHGFYKWAVREELLEVDPTVSIIRPRTRRTLPRPIDSDDLVLAIRAARPEMRAMLSLAAFAGLRCQEIAGLDRDDIIEAKNIIRVRMGKGAKERIVPLHPDVMEALRCLPLPRTGAIFNRPRGGRYSPNWMSATCNRYLKDLGINARTHMLRHWFASEVYANTHDIRVTQELLGHQSPQTTAGYIAYSHVAAAEAVGTLKIGG